MEPTRKQLLEKLLSDIGELHRCIGTSRDGFLAQFKISRPQMELLFSLRSGQKTTGELAKNFSITSSAISQMVDQLERKKLVERTNDVHDRRVTYIKLADQTRLVFEDMRAKYIAHLGERFADIGDEELERLSAILQKTIENVGKDQLWKK